jgi:hypothetical protein
MWPFRRRRAATPQFNRSWIDGQCIVIDLSNMRVSHRGDDTHGGLLAPADDHKVTRFLGEMSCFKESQGSARVSLLDDRDGMREETGVTADNRFLRLRVAEGRDPLDVTLSASICWQRATGRQLHHQDTPRA